MDVKSYKIIKVVTVPISLKLLLKGQIAFLAKNGFENYCVSSYGKEVEDLIANEPIVNYYTIDLTRNISVFKDLMAIWQCYKIIKKVNPDIVHTYTPKAGLVGMIASFLAGTKIRIHNITGLPLITQTAVKRNFLIIIEKIVYLLATNVYVNSKGLLNFVNENISKKVKILGNGSTNGIDTNFYCTNDTLIKEATKIKIAKGIIDTDFVWIFVGRIVIDKGILELVNAFENFSELIPNTKLLIVGDFENHLYPLPSNLIYRIFNNSKIICTGFANDVRPYLLASNCLLFPSYREGLPNVPLQAGCLNLPIIASNINGCNEIVVPNKNGILVEPKNSKELELAMIKLFTDHELRNTFISNSREFIISKYENKLVWANLLNEYNSLLKQNV